jgi:CRISPR-associated protein (TIGR03984 family)
MSKSDEQKNCALYVHVSAGLPLEKALAKCQGILSADGAAAVAIIYATNKCRFARLQTGGQLLDEDDQPLDLTSVYEARVFSEKAELRWWHKEGGEGDAALLSERELPVWAPEKTPLAVGTIPQTYLLWGESLPGQSKHNWIKMATPRIGHYFAPVEHDVEARLRVQLKAREFLCQESAHGNVYVFEERWLNLTTVVVREGEMKEANNE